MDAQGDAVPCLTPWPGTVTGGSALPDAGDAAWTLPDGVAWRFVRPVGAGGMGVVAVYEHVAQGFQVAIKRARGEGAQERARVHREAQLMRQLHHAFVPGVVEVIADPAIGFGYAMKYVPSATLADRIAAADLGADEALSVLRGLIGVLRYAHALGVVHRDLKPDNVLVQPDHGTIALIDWGIAGVVDAARTAPELARVAATWDFEPRAATPAWTAPEQRDGAPPDPRQDVFAMGRIVAACRPALIRGVVASRVGELDAIVRRATAEQPADRYPEVDRLGADLWRWAADQPLDPATARNGRAALARWARRNGARIAVGGAVTAVLVALGGLAARSADAARLAQAEQRRVSLEADLRRSERDAGQAMMAFLENRPREAGELAVGAASRGDPEATGVVWWAASHFRAPEQARVPVACEAMAWIDAARLVCIQRFEGGVRVKPDALRSEVGVELPGAIVGLAAVGELGVVVTDRGASAVAQDGEVVWAHPTPAAASLLRLVDRADDRVWIGARDGLWTVSAAGFERALGPVEVGFEPSSWTRMGEGAAFVYGPNGVVRFDYGAALPARRSVVTDSEFVLQPVVVGGRAYGTSSSTNGGHDLWELDAAKMRVLRTLPVDTVGIEEVALSPDAGLIVTCSVNLVTIVAREAWEIVDRIRLNDAAAGCQGLAFSPDGSRLAVSTRTTPRGDPGPADVRIFDVGGWYPRRARAARSVVGVGADGSGGHARLIVGVGAAPWEIERVDARGHVLGAQPTRARAYGLGATRSGGVAWAADGAFVAPSVGNRTQSMPIEADGNLYGFAPCGDDWVTWGTNGYVARLSEGAPPRVLDAWGGADGARAPTTTAARVPSAIHAACDAAGSRVYVGYCDRLLVVFNRSGAEVGRSVDLRGDCVGAVVVPPDSSRVWVYDKLFGWAVFDEDLRRVAAIPQPGVRWVVHALFSPDGRWLFGGDMTGFLHAWRVRGDAVETVARVRAGTPYVSGLALDPAAGVLWAGDPAGAVSRWSLTGLEAAAGETLMASP